MVAEFVAPLEDLVYVEGAGACGILVAASAYGLGIAADGGCEIGLVGVESVIGYVGRELEVLEEVHLNVSASGDVVAQRLVDVLLGYGVWV